LFFNTTAAFKWLTTSEVCVCEYNNVKNNNTKVLRSAVHGEDIGKLGRNGSFQL